MLSKRSRYPRWSLVIFLSAVLGMNIPANAACTNPATIPAGFAAPCPVWSPSASSVSQSSTLTLTATPQAGTDYILTTAYISQGTAWNPYTLLCGTGCGMAPPNATKDRDSQGLCPWLFASSFVRFVPTLPRFLRVFLHIVQATRGQAGEAHFCSTTAH